MIAPPDGDQIVGPPPAHTGRLEVLAVVGLILAWPVGVVLLWSSRVWSTRAKLIGSLVPPGGYAVPLIVVWGLFRRFIVSCTSVYDESGKLVSSNCPTPQGSPTLAGVALTVVIYVALLLWIVLPIVSAGYLAMVAWRSSSRARGTWLRLALVLAVVAGPVAVLSVVLAGVILSVTGQQALQAATAQAIPPSLSPPPTSDLTAGAPPFPNVTIAQFESALSGKGLSCSPSASLAGQWVTMCRMGSGMVIALGPNDHEIDVVTTNLVDRSQASQLFDVTVESACRPADVQQISTWMHGHIASGGQTDIDGYHVSISLLEGEATLSISRSRRGLR